MRTGAEVAIFVTRRGRSEVLVAHRNPSLGGYWHTIAGGVEEDETPAQAAVRELREETGLEAEPVRVVETVEYAYPLDEEPPERRARYPAGLVEVQVTCFLVDAPDDWEPTLDWEHDDHCWLPPAEAASLLRWPATADALRRAVATS
jgi:8-oxo-dGTP pyrophosphatase MutT (NUDIX family)